MLNKKIIQMIRVPDNLVAIFKSDCINYGTRTKTIEMAALVEYNDIFEDTKIGHAIEFFVKDGNMLKSVSDVGGFLKFSYFGEYEVEIKQNKKDV